MAQIDIFLQKMIESQASDFHLSVGSPPILRIHGEITVISQQIITPDVAQQVLFEIMSPSVRQILEKNWEVDFGYDIPNLARFRVNVFSHRYGMGAVFRLIPSKIRSLQELGAPPILKKFADYERGLILVTGPTGSGKSTTLAAMIEYINKSRKQHIITIEDPIEFIYSGQRSLITQREVGVHTHSFANALKSALREDPDVVLVGEMRDLETIEMAITAAETGHLILGTLHTSSAPRTIDRIINVFPPIQQEQVRQMLSESLLGVISQQLARRANKKGRVVIMEILVVHPAVSNLIREGKTFQIHSVIQTGKKYGMQTTDQVLWDLYMKKIITAEEAYFRATHKKQFESSLAKKPNL